MKLLPLLSFISLAGFAQDYVPFPASNAVWVNTIYEYSFEDPFPTPYLVDVKYYCVNGEENKVSCYCALSK